ncbi:hypothetical protein BGX29_010801 [Mortierella sp. GBA35]|nr:hypothetical protein BGX29_010801 [Mortierella sp. GBA35]KAF9092476.1 hypothetical protein BGX23_004268 [Mortierella sp. AD031]KAG0202893.1 hypothetical protein BGX33_009432 [Mortierella sp. NVP41]
MSQSLEIVVHSAHDLQKVERFGKNDPYAKLSLVLDENKEYKKTSVKKNAGEDAQWDETLVLENLKPHYTDLFVEVLDDDNGADAPIAYAAIPLNQIREAHNHQLSARYDLYNEHSVPTGSISLTIRVLQPGQEGSGRITYDSDFKKGHSHVNEEQKDRFKSLRTKEKASDAGVAAGLGGLAAIGAGFLKSQLDKKAAEKKHEE